MPPPDDARERAIEAAAKALHTEYFHEPGDRPDKVCELCLPRARKTITAYESALREQGERTAEVTAQGPGWCESDTPLREQGEGER